MLRTYEFFISLFLRTFGFEKKGLKMQPCTGCSGKGFFILLLFGRTESSDVSLPCFFHFQNLVIYIILFIPKPKQYRKTTLKAPLAIEVGKCLKYGFFQATSSIWQFQKNKEPYIARTNPYKCYCQVMHNKYLD